MFVLFVFNLFSFEIFKFQHGIFRGFFRSQANWMFNVTSAYMSNGNFTCLVRIYFAIHAIWNRRTHKKCFRSIFYSSNGKLDRVFFARSCSFGLKLPYFGFEVKWSKMVMSKRELIVWAFIHKLSMHGQICMWMGGFSMSNAC